MHGVLSRNALRERMIEYTLREINKLLLLIRDSHNLHHLNRSSHPASPGFTYSVGEGAAVAVAAVEGVVDSELAANCS
jgi:hypothetical protein